jgi:hypothetical protein
VGRDEVVVLLGTPNAESSQVYGLTVTEGDPAWAGALAGTALGLPVYHITEPEIATQVPPEVYAQEVGISEMVLDTEGIATALRAVRAGDATPS